MLTGPFLSKNWPGSADSPEEADCIMVGLPWDGTCSFRPGTRFAPQEIRLASQGIETYSPVFNRDLSEIRFFDAGELEFNPGNRSDTLFKIQRAAQETLFNGKKWIGIGGEHLVTLPAVKAYAEKYPELVVIQFDAHADLLDDYLGENLSHATVMRRITELVGPQNIAQIGIRSGTKDEYDRIKAYNTLILKQEQLFSRVQNRPVYLTIDLDVLDPSVFPGTGTPEPGGMDFKELQQWLAVLSHLNIVGADVVELAPHYDSSGVSTIVAAKVIREMLFLP